MVTEGSFVGGQAGGPWSLRPFRKGKVHPRTGHEGPEWE